MSHPIRTSAALLALFAVVALSGCAKDNNPTSPNAQARVMAVHASPDAPAVDLLVDGVVSNNTLTYPNNTPYVTVSAGTHNLKLNLAGTATTVTNQTVTLNSTDSYTTFAVGPSATIGTLLLSDDLTTPAPGKAHVRFLNLSPDAPAVDVAVTGGAVIVSNKGFQQFQAFTAYDAGTYNLEVRNTGTTNVLLSIPSVSLQSGHVYTIFLRGFLSGAGGQALASSIIVNK